MKIVNINIPCISEENKNKLFVYGIKNIITNKYYIGSSTGKFGISNRIRRHIRYLKLKQHHSQKLQRSFDKYNQIFENWEWILFEEITKETAIEREQYYIDKYDSYNNGYNSTKLAGIANSGEMRKSHKDAISKSKQKMTESEIIDIFQKYYQGMTYKEIGFFYKLSKVTIGTIINNERYYTEFKNKNNLKKISYLFYNYETKKFYETLNFTKFCNEQKISEKIMFQVLTLKYKILFHQNWTVFFKHKYNEDELNNRVNAKEKSYILYKCGKPIKFNHVVKFCKENKLNDTNIYNLLKGIIYEYKGYTISK